jgi:phosphoribosylformylglycinamidine synthase
MKAAVTVFPGSNCDRDMRIALERAGFTVDMVWHKDTALPAVDLVAVPGGFSFGDYLRCGAIAANAPVTRALKAHADRGGHVLGVCNGFQVLTETGLLPGALLRNAGLKYICRTVGLRIEGRSVFTEGYAQGEEIALPIAHHDGNYFADADTLDRLEGDGRVALRYTDTPNGSQRAIAGVLSENRRVLGMMPHPERAAETAHGNTDGARLFAHLAAVMEGA